MKLAVRRNARELCLNDVSGIYVAPHSESKWNDIGHVCSSDPKPQKDLNLALVSRRATLNTITNCYKSFIHHALLKFQ